ncbi:maltose-binding protein [[Pantoea] beijingensis]|uniref:Maltose-binding protein n=1 Tax=[Pantoea] beijingensis TaxID=1324864 RepID=A0A443IGE6_9GAMM|nr:MULTISPECIES: maltose operon protein MalM [Erwiniaceae]RWR03112.1 maltose-binding protein [[Pantoea] beijingensis]
MKKHLLALCLFPALSFTVLPAIAASQGVNPQDIATAPTLSSDKLQQLSWLPLAPPVSQDIELTASSASLEQGDVTGSVAAITLPADQGSLEITLSSIMKNKRVYAPNVLVLDNQLQPAAFFPSSYFPYQKPGVMAGNRLEGTMKLTPVLGQKQIYLLIYTTKRDLAQTSHMINPAKLYAEGANNAIPDVPDPVVQHVSTGSLSLKIKSEQNSGNIMIGKIFGSSDPKPVVVGSAATSGAMVSAPVTSPASAPATPVAPAAKAEPMLNDTESYFNNGIKQAVKAGDIDKALKLMNEAERLGSTSARATFISSVKGKG